MSAISETYNRAQLQQLKRNVIITNKNVKYELTNELPMTQDVRKSQNSMEL